MPDSALVETWCLYGVGTLAIVGRTFCRWRMIGVQCFKFDDYLILLAWVTYTVMTVAAHLVGELGDLHALTLAQRQQLTADQAAPLVLGTQWFCAGVATYVTFIWTLKLNMLFLYQRVVCGTWVAKFIKPTMCLVVATYISIMLILFCSCRPYHRMWIVYPDQGEFCKPQAHINLVPALVMNLLSDMCIMAIPAPVILPVRTTIWRKICLFVLFSAGIFIMTAAVLRVVFVLVLGNGKTAAIWSCREDLVAILVGQAPMLRPLFSSKFWARGAYEEGSTGWSTTPGGRQGGGVVGYKSYEMSGGTGRWRCKDPYSATVAMATVGAGDSTENIIGVEDVVEEGGESRGCSRGEERGGEREEERRVSMGHSRGELVGHARGPSRGESLGHARGHSRGESLGLARGESRGHSRAESRGLSRAESRGHSRGGSRGEYQGSVTPGDLERGEGGFEEMEVHEIEEWIPEEEEEEVWEPPTRLVIEMTNQVDVDVENVEIEDRPVNNRSSDFLPPGEVGKWGGSYGQFGANGYAGRA